MRHAALIFTVGLLAGVGGFWLLSHIATKAKPVGNSDFHDRIRVSLMSVMSAENPRTNHKKEESDRTLAIKGATPESLQKPVVISAHYLPQDVVNGTVPILLVWMEDKPTLKDVIVTNPETGKEEDITVPQSRLDRAIRTETSGYIYGFSGQVSVDVTGNDPTQVLEIKAPDQNVPATCYPSTFQK